MELHIFAGDWCTRVKFFMKMSLANIIIEIFIRDKNEQIKNTLFILLNLHHFNARVHWPNL